MHRLAAILIAFLLSSATTPTAAVRVDCSGLRNMHGMIHACLTRNPSHFPDCEADALALKRSVPAGSGHVAFDGVVPGRYALSAFHDENSNRKLDKFMGIPREGFGFSRNPKVRFGPPSFNQVSIEVTPGFARASVRMQYLL